jgi:hypothetical protein
MIAAPFIAALSGFGASVAGAAATAAPFITLAATGLTASSLLSRPKIPGVPSLPAAPAPSDSLADAQQTAIDRTRMIAATGGQTQYAGMGNTAIDPSQLQKKSLLGM